MNQAAIEKKQNTDFFTNDFSREVFETKYKYGNETVQEMRSRVANAMAAKETIPQEWAERFSWLLEDFKFIPGGRILSNAGLPFKGTTMINCYVSGFQGYDRDSWDSISDELRRQGKILKSEGGYGFCVDTLRPRYSYIAGIGAESPGSVKMLDMWDTQSDVITAGSGKKSGHTKAKNGIRKGAQMVTMSIWHPDIEEFITAKLTPGRLSKFNMSVLVTDKFMKAVREHSAWQLEFPDIDSDVVLPEGDVRSVYKSKWDGNIESWKNEGYPVKVYKEYSDAAELWDLITNSTYKRNEPGILFVDRINYWNNLHWLEYINATNPCGEQPLPIGGVCLLGNINLTQFVNDNGWDYDKLGEVIRIAVRFMDNVNDITYVPLEEQKKNLVDKRRIGLGVMGYASALVMMKKRYGSDEALKLTHEVMSFIMNAAYQSSAMLASEKGTFNQFDLEQYMKGNFIQQLDEDTKDLIRTFGMRNSHLLSIQPTGNTSSYANVVSGGLEPIFRPEYKRTAIVTNWPDNVDFLEFVNFESKTFDVQLSKNSTCAPGGEWAWIKEGDDNLLRSVYTENDVPVVYKFDKNRGLTKESIIMDYGVLHLLSKNEYDASADYMADAAKLSIDDHINTMAVIAKYIDSAMSKTINIPNDYSFEDFKGVYDSIYDSGVVKGCTTYRDGTMANVLADITQDQQKESEIKILRTKAPKRPKVLDCDIHHLTISNEKWLVLVGLYGEARDPYEVFAFKRNGINISPKITTGKLVKAKLRTHQTRYDLDMGDFEIEDICSHFKSGEESALTRMLSTALRHGADIDYIYDQLNKSEGSIVSFSKAIARAMKKYVKTIHSKTCPVCGKEDALVMTEGCMKCIYCGDSKCG